jgi:hypothetical protein
VVAVSLVSERLSCLAERERLVSEREKTLVQQRTAFEESIAPAREELATTRLRLSQLEARLESWSQDLARRADHQAMRSRQEEAAAQQLRQERDADFMEQRCRLRILKDEVDERELALAARQVHAAQFELRLQELERQHNAAIETMSRRHAEDKEEQQRHLEQRFITLAEERENLARERSLFLSERAEYLAVLQQHEMSNEVDLPLGQMRRVQSLIQAFTTRLTPLAELRQGAAMAVSATVNSSPSAASSGRLLSAVGNVDDPLESTILSSADDNKSGVRHYTSRRLSTTVVRSPMSSEKKKQQENRDTWMAGAQKQLTFA